ncbi:MAG: hypothetical protein OEZ22_00130 [Spirochaetia bacterium]|nr:hypothetical protein [Spirochaetia bacterium]
MIRILLIFINRTKIITIFISLVYALSYFQLCLHFYFQSAKIYNNPLLEIGYLIGIVGLFSGIIGIQFIIGKIYAYDMGNLETMGFTRISYLTYYLIQLVFSILIGIIIGIIVFHIFQFVFFYIESKDIKLYQIHLAASWRILSLYTLSTGIIYFYHSKKDPMLLIKEKL